VATWMPHCAGNGLKPMVSGALRPQHYRAEHSPLPRTAGGRHETAGRPHRHALQAGGNLFIDGQPLIFPRTAIRRDSPAGFQYLKKFRLDPFPVFTYEIEGIEIEKTVFMIQVRTARWCNTS